MSSPPQDSNSVNSALANNFQTAILTFVNNVASLAVEQCLLSGLPKIFSVATIRDMEEKAITSIASESSETLRKRERLSERVKVLRDAVTIIERIHPAGKPPSVL